MAGFGTIDAFPRLEANLLESEDVMPSRSLHVAALLSAFAAAPSFAESVCGPRADFIQGLGIQFGEMPTARAMVATGQTLEVLTSSSGSWTMILTDPDGRACIVGVGEAWTAIPMGFPQPAAIERPA